MIFGAAGMLARALIHPLQRAGFRCAGLTHHDCDITSVESVINRLRQFRPDILINCAAYTQVNRCEEQPASANAVNAEAVGQLALMARVYNLKLVHFSTDAVFDGQKSIPYEPDDAVAPLSAYARSKLLGEEAIEDINPGRWLIIRTAWLFGDGNCFPRTILRQARHGEHLQVVGDQYGSPTSANDVADATAKLLASDAHGTWHVVNSGEASWFDVARETLEIAGLHAPLTRITTDEYLRVHPRQAQRPRYSVLSTAAYTRAMGAPLRDWQDALRAARETFVTPLQSA